MDDSQIPEYLYFPTIWMKAHGQQTWARLRFLSACKRLNIPEQLWPKVDLGSLNLFPAARFTLPPSFTSVFTLPDFDFVNESPTDWRTKADAAFRLHCDDYLRQCLDAIEKMVQDGHFQKVPSVRDKNAPLTLRYEWAVRRYCLREQFKEIATELHSADAIQKAVYKILKDVGLPRKRK